MYVRRRVSPADRRGEGFQHGRRGQAWFLMPRSHLCMRLSANSLRQKKGGHRKTPHL